MNNKTITLADFLSHLRDIVRSNPIEGLKTDIDTAHFGAGASFRWDRAWAVNAQLHVEVRVDTDAVLAGADPVGTVLAGISWSASQRDIATAKECLALYAAVTDLAAKIEAEFVNTNISMKR